MAKKESNRNKALTPKQDELIKQLHEELPENAVDIPPAFTQGTMSRDNASEYIETLLKAKKKYAKGVQASVDAGDFTPANKQQQKTKTVQKQQKRQKAVKVVLGMAYKKAVNAAIQTRCTGPEYMQKVVQYTQWNYSAYYSALKAVEETINNGGLK